MNYTLSSNPCPGCGRQAAEGDLDVGLFQERVAVSYSLAGPVHTPVPTYAHEDCARRLGLRRLND